MSYQPLDTDDRLSPISPPRFHHKRSIFSRLWPPSHWHRPYVRTGIYIALALAALYTLYDILSPAPRLFPLESIESGLTPPWVWRDRAQQVKDAFLHGYHGYETHGFGHDEVGPVSNETQDRFNGWGVTLYDSLDTMLLMGFDVEYDRALAVVEKATFDLPPDAFAPYFETVIRYLGGILSAYALRPNEILLRKAELLADKLDPIFGSDSGFPFFAVNPSTGDCQDWGIGSLAEIASLQIEYTYLAKISGKKKYYDRAHTVNQNLYSANLQSTGGMLPVTWNLTSGQPHDDHLSAGAQADSAHEYLLKQYLLTGRTDKASLEMYLRFTTQVITNLLYVSPSRHLLYVTDTTGRISEQDSKPTHIFEHLSCFLPGLLALGAHLLPLDNLSSLGIDIEALGNEDMFGKAGKNYSRLKAYNLKDLHLWVARGLTETCWLTYADQPSGLAPDEVLFTRNSPHGKPIPWLDVLESWRRSGARGTPPGVGDKPPLVYAEGDDKHIHAASRDYKMKKTHYLLRPETLESIYFMWKITGETRWRIRGWKIFQSLMKETQTEAGFASLASVAESPAAKFDHQPSYFYAETLKYLYLMFAEDDPIPLDRWVFNTEAHPYPRFEWSTEEKSLFGI